MLTLPSTLVFALAMVMGVSAWATERPELKWDPVSWTVEGLALGGRTPLAGLGGSVGRPFGTLVEGLTNEATGWVLTPGLDVTVARVFGPACEPVSVPCEILPFAFRLAAGPSLKFGRAEGAINSQTHLAHASLVVSLAVTAFAAFYRVDAAPLAPSSTFTDFIIRGRLGIMHPSHVFSIAIVVEGSVLNPLVRGVDVGLAVGVSY